MREPLSGARFEVQIDGLEVGGVSAVALPEARTGVVGTRTRPLVEVGALVLRRGLTGSAEWYGWWDEARRARRKAERTVTVTLLDAAGAARVSWRYSGARPDGYAVSGLDAMASDVVIETLQLRVAGFEASFAPDDRAAVRVSPGRKAPGRKA